jgi:hypothetical protein
MVDLFIYCLYDEGNSPCPQIASFLHVCNSTMPSNAETASVTDEIVCEELVENPVPLCPPEVSHGMAWD